MTGVRKQKQFLALVGEVLLTVILVEHAGRGGHHAEEGFVATCLEVRVLRKPSSTVIPFAVRTCSRLNQAMFCLPTCFLKISFFSSFVVVDHNLNRCVVFFRQLIRGVQPPCS